MKIETGLSRCDFAEPAVIFFFKKISNNERKPAAVVDQGYTKVILVSPFQTSYPSASPSFHLNVSLRMPVRPSQQSKNE